MKKSPVWKSRMCLLVFFMSIIVLLDTSSLLSNAQTQEGNKSSVRLSDWTTSISEDTTILINYVGSAKEVVIPASGDLGTTHVEITKKALRAAATSADEQGGTLVNSSNDPNGTGLVAENATDDNPFDQTVDYSGTFKDLSKITKIDLSKLKIKVNDGTDGADVTGADEANVTGGNGNDGESLNVSSMFENCTSLKIVNLDAFVGEAGNGGNGGDGYGGRGGDGYGGRGGNGGKFTSDNMFAHTNQLVTISLNALEGASGNGGRGGNGYGGDCYYNSYGGYFSKSGNGYGGNGGDGGGCNGGNGYGGDGGGCNGGNGYGGDGSHGGNGTGGDGSNGGDGHGGDGYGGNGGNGTGGNGSNGGNGTGGDGISYAYVYIDYTIGGGGGNGYGGTSAWGMGGNGTGGNGDLRIGIGLGGIGDNFGGGTRNGISTNGILDSNLKPENLTGEKLRIYRLYTETASTRGMYCPIAVKEITQTLKTTQIVSDAWFRNNIGALRNPDTGDDLLTSEKEKVQITAINAHGTKVDLADITKTPGTYTVSYSYRNETIQTTVTVKDANIVTKDLTIGTGDAWKAQDNFVSAVDAGGQPIGFNQLTVTGADQVNVNQPGSYSVTYAYQTASQTAKVNVIDIQTQKLASLDLDATFDVYAGLKSVTNVDQIPHTDLAYFQAQVSVKGVLKGTSTPIDLTSFTRTAGTYTIIYTYAGISRSIDVVVEKKH